MRIVSVVGARPQFVKAAVVSRALREAPEISEILVHTGQHYDDGMSQVFFDELDIPAPAVNLGIGSGTHGAQTGAMLAGLEAVLLRERPQWVLVYGDTNSTLAGSLAAAKLHLPVAHVEAGLRSFNRGMPEEINRIVTDHVSDLLFAPTDRAVANLVNEGVPRPRIHQVGDVMYDAVRLFSDRARERSRIVEHLQLTPDRYILCTIHRAENTDRRDLLCAIVAALATIGATIPIVFPVHPRTRKALAREGLDDTPPRLRLIEPLGYLDTLALERQARLIITDSGGMQKEALFHGVPCLTLRTETEWTELVDAGWNRCVAPGEGSDQIVATALQLLRTPKPAAVAPGLYGDGNAAGRIAGVLLEEGRAAAMSSTYSA